MKLNSSVKWPKQKVVGVGLQKTGTTTLGACLTELGYEHKSYDRKALWHLRRNNFGSLIDMMKEFESFEDEPWARMYKLADAEFPNAKFILTERKSSDAWFDSLARHCDRILFNEHRSYLFGTLYPREQKEQIVRIYEKHNAAVKKYFEGREGKLLVMSFDGDSQEDAWEKICDFLECEKPKISVPKKNSAPGKKFPKQTRFRTYLYVPKYIWIVIKQELVRPIYRKFKF